MLLDLLINDEKKNNLELYSSGPYWKYKNNRTISEIKKHGLNNFRGINTSIGTSFSDNLILDVRNEFNIKGRIVGKIFSLPILSKIFKAQLKQNENNIKSYIDNQGIVYRNDTNVLNLINKYKFENTTAFNCVKKFQYLDKEYSTHYLEMVNRIDKLSSLFNYKKINSFFEIGGGFGANIHSLISNFPNIKKIVYLDIVPNIYVGTEYLRFHYKDKVKDYLSFKNLNQISFSDDNELEILCIPPWAIERLNVKIDHFHNASSFVEMPVAVIKNYCKYIKKLETKDISLISYDKFDLKTSLDPTILNNYFDNKLKISWKETLIKEYDRKDVYLTSN